MEITTQQTTNNNDTVARIIDNVLNQVFGKEATLLIYRHLERNYDVRRNEIGDKIELFTQGLEDFLRSGATVIERKILEDINSNCNLLRRAELENVSDETSFITQMKLVTRKA